MIEASPTSAVAAGASPTWNTAQNVPVIFTPPVERPILPWRARLMALGIAGAALAVLVIAVTLTPNPAGVGTHRAMGYPACQFMATTGLPCPTCGMTTSFAWFVRGHWLASIYVQPMGFLLAILTGTTFWAGLYIFLTGRPIHRLLKQFPMVWVISTLLGFGIAAWGWKIWIHLRGIDGWR